MMPLSQGPIQARDSKARIKRQVWTTLNAHEGIDESHQGHTASEVRHPFLILIPGSKLMVTQIKDVRALSCAQIFNSALQDLLESLIVSKTLKGPSPGSRVKPVACLTLRLPAPFRGDLMIREGRAWLGFSFHPSP